jgi:hypothetical protein
MEHAGEEAKEEPARRSTRPLGRPGAERGQTPRQPHKWPQGVAWSKAAKNELPPG